MTSVHDLISAAVPETDSVTFGDAEMPIRPVSMIEILRVMRRYPELKILFDNDATRLIDLLIDVGPEALSALIACALCQPGDINLESAIQALPDDKLIPLLAAAIRVTMPDGIQGFFGKLAALAEAAGLLAPGDHDGLNEAA